MYEEITGKLALLHHARQREAENKAKIKDLMDTFVAEHAEEFDGRKITEEAKNRIEADVRETALVLWKTVPNLEKTSIPGVTIRESKVVGFDPETAKEWAIQHQIALKLDEVAYKKLVLAGQAPGSVDKTFTAAIAADLSEFWL